MFSRINNLRGECKGGNVQFLSHPLKKQLKWTKLKFWRVAERSIPTVRNPFSVVAIFPENIHWTENTRAWDCMAFEGEQHFQYVPEKTPILYDFNYISHLRQHYLLSQFPWKMLPWLKNSCNAFWKLLNTGFKCTFKIAITLCFLFHKKKPYFISVEHRDVSKQVERLIEKLEVLRDWWFQLIL